MLPLLSVIGEMETLLSEHLYPYRYVITPIAALLVLAALFIAIKQGLHLTLWRHRVASTIVGGPLLVVAIVAGNYLVSPLWERSHLIEESPLAVAASMPGIINEGTGMGSAPVVNFMPHTTAQGMFRGADDFHFGRGDALVLEVEPGKHLLRLENFSVRNGPDLYVYLSSDAAGKRVEEALNLGRLKATDGAFNYEIPAGTDLSQIKSVLIWCKAFSTLFAVAPFVPA